MFNKKVKRNRVLIFLDFDNLFINFKFSRPSFIDELNKALRQIAKEIGEIIGVFVFAPYQTQITFGETLYKENFFLIVCPKVKTKDGQEKDTTDEIIIKLGEKMISEMPAITHFFLGSGDSDFETLLKEASLHGLDTGIISSDLESLSSNLIPHINRKPNTKEKMIYILSSQE
ncbi:MAG: NYN domain-containing protein [Candidatus Pacebacteria bacterium]|nr:NYN domain-containing protein [Candidatus Paceibacterota bacterium]